MLKKLLHRKLTTMFLILFCVGFLLPAQVLSVPNYSVQRTKNGFIYTFSVKTNELVRYRVFDSFTGIVSTGQVPKTGRLSVNHNDTVTVWTENLAGARSRELTLSKKTAAETQQAFSVLSPVAGTWANKQVLAVSADAETEVYYSFSGTNPLEFGFAYDGPVLIDASGEVILNITAVHADGSVSEREITYTVAEPAGIAPPLKVSSVLPVVNCGVHDVVELPRQSLYAVGSSIPFFMESKTLCLQYPSCIGSILPLTVKNSGYVYRYLLQTVDVPQTDLLQQLTVSSPIQIINWNFVMFNDNQNVSYSIDGGSWIKYIEPFYIDRNDIHIISWHYGGAVDSLELPAKPHIIGLPSTGETNAPVELQCSDSRYTFRIEKDGELSRPLSSFYVDTLYGDVQSFALNLAVYYGNIRQGDIPVSFTIDKQPPEPPVFQCAEKDAYTRDDAVVSILSSDSVYTAVDELYSYMPFYGSTETTKQAENTSQILEKTYSLLAGSKILLCGDETYAVSYSVYAYAQDSAGNRSMPVQFEITVDKNNFYIDAESVTEAYRITEGSPQEPYSSFPEAVRTANSREKTTLHIKGNITSVPELQILSDCAFIGYNDAVVSFAEDGVLIMKDADVSFENVSFEKSNNSVQITAGKKMMFSVENSAVSLNNCQFLMHGGSGSSVISCRGGSLFLSGCSISIQSGSHVTAVSADNTTVMANRIRCILPDSSVGFSLMDSVCRLENADFSFTGIKGRGIELYNCTYWYADAFEQGIDSRKTPLVVWKDVSSVECGKPLFPGE